MRLTRRSRRPAGAIEASHPAHPSLRRWVAFDPPLRDPKVAPTARREVSCRMCGASFGSSDDPLEVLLLAWRQRHHMAAVPGRRLSGVP